VSQPAPPPWPAVADLVNRTLAEDLGRAGDITSNATIPQDHRSTGHLVGRTPGRVAGLAQATMAFTLVDESVRVALLVPDASDIVAGELLATATGPTRALLAAERTCLNLLGHLSGVATATAEMMRLVSGTKTQIVDTRKTLPGLRALQKYAVRCGGGANHRFGLDDAVLIKDNHIAAVGSISAAIKAARHTVGHMVNIEVEVDTLDQLDEALAVGVDAVLLDNMSPSTLAEAVRRVGGRCITEASGGVTPETVRTIAESGVDLISTGWITHSAPQLDIGFDLGPIH
jgi:nicotinate-nucleotide pyrophosphorylase (carboxylating)